VVQGTLTAPSGIEIGAGESLSGSGNVVATVHVLAGGSMLPGTNGAGGLALGGLTYAASPASKLVVELAGLNPGTEHDQFIASGPVNLGGATLELSVDFLASVGDSFVILRNDSGAPITGQFAQGATIASGPFNFSINYAGGVGNDDVVLTLTSIVANNTAPVLDNSANLSLATIDQGEINNAGTLVRDIIVSAGGDRITDADGDPEGIALTAVNTANGPWE
jgi:hypothetical protein